jgi:ATP-binding cassette, subfamily C, bacterial
MFERETVRFVGHFVRAYPGRTVLMVGLLILAGFAEGLGVVTLLPVLELAIGTRDQPPSAISQAVADVLAGVGLSPTLGILLSVIVVAMVAKAAFKWMAMNQVGYAVAQIATDLRLRLFRALMKARWSHFTSRPTGHFSNAISSEAGRAARAYKEACDFFASLIQVAVYLALVLLLSWQMALIIIAVGLGVVYLLRRFVTMAREAGRRETRLMKQLVWRLTDALPGIKPIKAMGRERHLLPLLEEEANDFNEAQRRQVLAAESLKAFQEPILVVAIAVGLFLVLTWGNEPFATVLVMVFLFNRAVGRINSLQSKYQHIAKGESAFTSIHSLAQEAERAEEVVTGRQPPPPLEQGIRIEQVSFSYGRHRVLDQVSLTIPSGSFVALIGPSGAGKTTLADLVAGLHRPQEGEIFLDHVPLGELDLPGWRAQIGYVPQETLLFDASVYRNVTLGDQSVSREEVRRALEAAGAWEFVSRLEKGLDHPIGQQGARLSGGQRQRIAIARALVGRPRLLILDEATTALDPATEQGILDTLAELGGQVTVLAISHQPAMKRAADIVYEVADGRVTMTSPPREIPSTVEERV